MTNPNWWDDEPFRKQASLTEKDHYGGVRTHYFDYDLPLIIAEVEKRGETEVIRVGDGLYACGERTCNYYIQASANFCPHCGAKIAWDK